MKSLKEAEDEQIKELTWHEREVLSVMMIAFQQSAQETMSGGEYLLRMCDGCAFKQRTQANQSPLTSMKALECVLKEEPFYCHNRFRPDGNERLCNGWINIMNNK